MFKIMVSADEEDTYVMNHSDACELLDNLDVLGIEACRDAEDYGDATYMSPQYGPIFIEYLDGSIS